MGFRTMLGELRGREHRSVALLGDQVSYARQAVQLAIAAVNREMGSAEAQTRMVELERAGDQARGRFVEELASAIAPPMDREDLFRVSRSVDDVLDNLRDFSRELDLFGVEEPVACQEALVAIGVAVNRLGEAIDHASARPGSVPEAVLQASKSGNDVRRRYQEAMAELLAEDPVTVEMLRTRELLRRLDVIGLKIGEAAAALADGAVKRAH